MRFFALAAILVATPAVAADLWTDESGDFYLERTDVDLSLFAEEVAGYPRTYCEVPRWPTKDDPVTMTCDNGTTHKIEVKDAKTLRLNGVEFYKVN